jgi:uncharacterized protein (TIGR02284 family)
MTSIEEDAVITLNMLIETCKDGELGFRTAADDTRTAETQRTFLTLAGERAELAAELQREVQRLGGTPAVAGSVSGSLHRGWMNVTAAVTGSDERSIIAAAERGEASAKTTYERALREPLPAATRTLVERQYDRIRAAHDRFRSLKRAA